MDIRLVSGPPCSGKTTFAKKNMQPGDVIIDADLLAQALGSPSTHDHPGHTKALAAKLRDVATREAVKGSYTTWVVSASPLAEKLIPHTKAYCQDPGIQTCLERAKGRPHWTREAIKEWYEKREIPEPSRFTGIQWLRRCRMTIVYGTVTNVSGQPIRGARVSITLNSGGVNSTKVISKPGTLTATALGYWQIELVPNSDISPAGTFYVIRHYGVKYFVSVPDSETPVPVTSILLPSPANPLTTQTYVNDVDGHYGSVSAQTIIDIAGGGGGGGAVASVDGRTGAVTLGDLYATAGHNHSGVYATAAHHHDAVYSALGHNHDSSYATIAHDHAGVYSVVSHNHDSSYSAISHTHAGVYLEPGDEVVQSVEGRIGEVTLDDIYAAFSHNHDSAYAASGHSHSYPVTSVDGLTGAVSLASVYSAAGHNHNSTYSQLSHNHDGTYATAGHTHTYPVTSVDGLTGAVSLSSVYSGTSHNHNATYATISHNHDATYATIGHTHSQFTVGTWTTATMGTNVGGLLQWRSEPVYGVVRLRTNGRLYATSGTIGQGATLATLPVGARPSTEIKWVMYQGAEPTQNLIILKLSTAGVVTIVNTISLSGTQASGIIIDHTFAIP